VLLHLFKPASDQIVSASKDECQWHLDSGWASSARGSSSVTELGTSYVGFLKFFYFCSVVGLCSLFWSVFWLICEKCVGPRWTELKCSGSVCNSLGQISYHAIAGNQT
jgi:hypothetical protein